MWKILSLKQKAIFVGIILVVLGGIIWFAYSKGASKTVIAPLVNDSPDNNTPGISDTEVNQIAQSLYDDMSGFNLLGHKTQPYESLLALSDTDFLRVYNKFNSSDYSGGKTLEEWVNDEYDITDPTGIYAFNQQYTALISSIKERFAKFNLK